MKRASVCFLMLTVCLGAHAEVLRVGPQEAVRTLGEAALRARNGDTIEVAAGEYFGDVAIWNQSDLTIRGVGGMVRLHAVGMHAEGKGIWVTRGERITVENFEFSGARVPDGNGAGIRLERGSLNVRNCRFLDNQNGILTANDPAIVLQVERSEFGHNGNGSGQTHNLYAGLIARLVVTGSYFHHAEVGHLLKSRAAQNFVLYNRLTDEPGGRASYELEFPVGGLAVVIGNQIEQSGSSENSTIVSFGAEGSRHPHNALFLIHNTIFDDRTPAGRYVDVRQAAAVHAYNNVLVGGAKWALPAGSREGGNVIAEWRDFALAVRQDYRPHEGVAWAGRMVSVPAGILPPDLQQTLAALSPGGEYVHPLQVRRLAVPARLPGAVQETVR